MGLRTYQHPCIMWVVTAIEWNLSFEKGILTFIGEYNIGIAHVVLRCNVFKTVQLSANSVLRFTVLN